MSGVAARAWVVAIVVLMSGCLPTYRVVPAPPARAMPPHLVLGTWQTNFGDVRIEADESRGGLAAGAVTGTWTYFNPSVMGEVRGVFRGTVQGTVLRFSWREGDGAAAFGDGFVELTHTGDAFVGRWWNSTRTKAGIWRGVRSNTMRGEV